MKKQRLSIVGAINLFFVALHIAISRPIGEALRAAAFGATAWAARQQSLMSLGAPGI